MRDEIEVRQTASRPATLDVEVTLGADFAHVFDVKGGRTGRRTRRRRR